MIISFVIMLLLLVHNRLSAILVTGVNLLSRLLILLIQITDGVLLLVVLIIASLIVEVLLIEVLLINVERLRIHLCVKWVMCILIVLLLMLMLIHGLVVLFIAMATSTTSLMLVLTSITSSSH